MGQVGLCLCVCVMASVHAAWIIVCCVFASTDEQLTQKQEKCVDLVYRIVNKRVRVCVCVCVCVSVSVCVCVFCLFEGVGEGKVAVCAVTCMLS